VHRDDERLLEPVAQLAAQVRDVGVDRARRDAQFLVDALDRLEHRSRTVSREELLEEIWGVDEELGVTTRTVDTHVSNLRSKLGDGFEKPFIVAVHKVGYKFVEP